LVGVEGLLWGLEEAVVGGLWLGWLVAEVETQAERTQSEKHDQKLL
jgi:hypothetical protein